MRSLGRAVAATALALSIGATTPGARVAQAIQPVQPVATPAPAPIPPAGPPASIYWGAFLGDGWPADDMSAVEEFESIAGKQLSIVQWGAPWQRGGNLVPFQTRYFERVRAHGSIPMLDWGSWDSGGNNIDQPDFTLRNIAEGAHDEFLIAWAQQAAAWGHPFFLRLNPEMNGWWLPWSEQVNYNERGYYVLAWQHVVDIFRQEGAYNATWVWCPNIVGQYSTPLARLYPGDDYVDWTCMDGYNWGSDRGNTGWWSFAQVFSGSSYTGWHNTYEELLDLAPTKPIMIGETATSEDGGSKADWISQGLGFELPTNFPRVQAVIWFNWNANDPTLDWSIDSSPEANAAFAEVISAPAFAANAFSTLAVAPIPPPDVLVAATH